MTDIKLGDPVKITLYGEVKGFHQYYDGSRSYIAEFVNVLDRVNLISYLPASALDVTTRPIKVGDTVTKDQLNDLPIHSYVRGQAHGGHFLRTPLGAWRSAHGIFEAGVLGGPFTVLYIPED